MSAVLKVERVSTTANAPRGRMVGIGGRRLHLVAEGPASQRPPVLLESGGFGVAADWACVQERLADRLPSLAYDRAGLGLSDPVPGPASDSGERPRDAAAIVDDLQAILAAINRRGPYVLVAHSTAAIAMQLFAIRRPEAVAGLVLVDAVPPEAMGDRRAVERLRTYERAAGFAPTAAKLGLLWMADPLAGNPIGLKGEAAQAKREAFASETHNRWAAAEAREWLKDAAAIRDMGELSRELPVAVITVGGGDVGLRELMQAPARRSRRGYAEHVPAASAATILGPRFAEAVVRAIDQVARYTRSAARAA